MPVIKRFPFCFDEITPCVHFTRSRRFYCERRDFLSAELLFSRPPTGYPPRSAASHCPPKPTMVAVCRTPRLLLFLLLLLLLRGGAPARIPPHEQVARVARFVAHQSDWASLATISSQASLDGRPFSNVFSVSDGPVDRGSGTPYMFLTRMEVSVQDLQVDPRASMSMSLAQTDYCRLQGFDPQSPLCAHIILSGSVLQVNGSEAEFAKTSLFGRHPEMKDWPKDHDWFFAKFNVTQVWVLDYFGGVKTVTPEEYFRATPYRKHR